MTVLDGVTVRRIELAEVAATRQAILDGGWGDRQRELEFYVHDSPAHVFVAEANDGAIVGTSIAVQHGRAGWVGLVFTAPAWRGRGLGGVLTATALQKLRDLGCGSFLLAATPLGRPIYLRLGFQDAGSYTVYAGTPSPSPPSPRGAYLATPGGMPAAGSADTAVSVEDGSDDSVPSTPTGVSGEVVADTPASATSPTVRTRNVSNPGDQVTSEVREMTPGDLAGVVRLDREATGEDRGRILDVLVRRGTPGWVVGGADDVRGFAFRTPWGFGPVVAFAPADAQALLAMSLSQAPPSAAISLAVPTGNLAVQAYLTSLGLTEQRTLPRMLLGDPVAWQPDAIWCVINFALG